MYKRQVFVHPGRNEVSVLKQFETVVGTAVKELFADAAAGRAIITESVKAKLDKAQQQMSTS